MSVARWSRISAVAHPAAPRSDVMEKPMAKSPKQRAKEFCERFGLELPILLAPMAGACPPSLSIAVANAGGMGACGALLLKPDAIAEWQRSFGAGSNRPVQLNLWI